LARADGSEAAMAKMHAKIGNLWDDVMLLRSS
jgi:hypothetical protein